MISLIDFVELPSKEKIELLEIKTDNKKSKTILIIGSFHGDEEQGSIAIEKYFSNKDIISKNHIFIVPCFNPDGRKLNQRWNKNKVDLNRNFPTKNWALSDKTSDYFGGNAPSSEKETKFMVKILDEIKPDFILSLHSPFGIVNFDGPATNEAKKISEIMEYPMQQDIGYPTPGSFGTYCGVERNIPTITLEYKEDEDIESICKKTYKIFDYLLSEY